MSDIIFQSQLKFLMKIIQNLLRIIEGKNNSFFILFCELCSFNCLGNRRINQSKF